MDTATKYILKRDSILLMLELRALWIIAFLYFLSFLFYLAWLLEPDSRSGRKASRLFITGALIHLIVVILRTIEGGRPPYQTGFEMFLGVTSMTALTYIFVEKKFKDVFVAGLPAAGICCVLCLYAIVRCHPGNVPTFAALQGGWFACYAILIPVSYALFAVAFSVELSYFILTMLIPLRILPKYCGDIATAARFHRMTHQLVLFGFPLLTFGLVSGVVWTELAYARYWLWHPYEVWALITWIVYAAYLHSMTMSSWRRRMASVFNMLGFACTVMAILSVNCMPGMFRALDSHVKFMR